MSEEPPRRGAALRLGLIGAGRWGRAYIRTLKSMAGVELARLCSANPESPKLAGPGCRVTEDWRELAGAEDLDGLILATPPGLHAEMAEAAAAAGLPVMIEKPLTLDLDEALRLQETFERTGTTVLVDHIHLFHPAYRCLKEEAARFGRLTHIRGEGGSRGPFRADSSPLWDYGPHDIAMCLDLFGEAPSSVAAEREEARPTGEGYGEVISIRLEFPGGGRAAIRVGNLMPEKRRRLTAYCERGALDFNDLAADKLILHEGAPPPQGEDPVPPPGAGRPEPVSDALPLTCAIEAFAAAIRGESREGLGLGLAVEVVRVLTACEAALPARPA